MNQIYFLSQLLPCWSPSLRLPWWPNWVTAVGNCLPSFTDPVNNVCTWISFRAWDIGPLPCFSFVFWRCFWSSSDEAFAWRSPIFCICICLFLYVSCLLPKMHSLLYKTPQMCHPHCATRCSSRRCCRSRHLLSPLLHPLSYEWVFLGQPSPSLSPSSPPLLFMSVGLFLILNCPFLSAYCPWTQMPTGCYQFFQDSQVEFLKWNDIICLETCWDRKLVQNWSQAQHLCKQRGGRLAELAGEENNRIGRF